MALTREQIDAAKGVPRETVNVPEWGGDVYIKGLTCAELEQIENEIAGRPQSEIRVRFVARCLVGDDGNRLFSDKEFAALNQHSSIIIDRLYEVVERMNCLRRKDIEELEKN